MPKPIVCILGGSGFVGDRLMSRLARRPLQQVRALRHSRDIAVLPGTSIVRGSVHDARALEQLLCPGAVVVNMVNFGDRTESARTGALTLATACAEARIARLVHVSTAVVVGDAPTGDIDEYTPCNPGTPYEHAKLSTENSLREGAEGTFELVILRPTAVFGPGGRNLITLVRRLQSGSRTLRYLRACIMGRRCMNVVDVEAVAAAIEFLALFPHKFDEQIFIVSDDDEPTNNYLDLERALARRMRVPGYPFPVFALPSWMLRSVLRMTGRPSRDPDRRYSWARLRGLGFEKPRPFDAALEEFAASISETSR